MISRSLARLKETITMVYKYPKYILENYDYPTIILYSNAVFTTAN